MGEQQETLYIDINEVQKHYLPISKKIIRRIVTSYLKTIKVGNKIMVDRKQLLEFLQDPDRDYIK